MATHENSHYGPTLDSVLKEKGLLEHAQAVALKRVIALQLQYS